MKEKNNSGANLKSLLLLAGICAVIPHLILFLLELDSIASSLSPAESEGYSNFFVSQWIPFWLAFLSYMRLQKRDSFSLLSPVCALAIVLTFLPRYPQRSVAAINLTIPLLFAVELFALLKRGEDSRNPFLRGIAADRGMLRSFLFWALVFPCVVLISCKACTWEKTVVSPFQMLPIPGVLLFDVFRYQKSQLPTLWGVLGMLAAVPLSLFLVTIGPMEQFRVYHLMSLVSGYVILFLLLTVYNMDQWKKADR